MGYGGCRWGKVGHKRVLGFIPPSESVLSGVFTFVWNPRLGDIQAREVFVFVDDYACGIST